MEKAKKYSVVIMLALVIVIITPFAIHRDSKKYSLADFGMPPLLKPDCSSLKTANNNSPVTINLNAPNVSAMRDKIKNLITKYNGHITSDSFSSYAPSVPAVPTVTSSQDSTNSTATFDKSEYAFLTELSDVVKSSGGVNSGYTYTDGSQPQYNTGYSSYASCVNSMMNISSDILQLKVLTNALKEERETLNISLLSQSITNFKITLQSDINTVNSYFTVSDQPSVSISVNSLQK